MEYLLNRDHVDGALKAELFSRFGFRIERWEDLAEALRQIPFNHEVVRMVESLYGIRYSIDGTLPTPDRRNPRVRTVWI